MEEGEGSVYAMRVALQGPGRALSESQAIELINSTDAGIRLDGWRGRPAADRTAVIEATLRLGQLAHDFPEVNELEVNPLYTLAEGSGAYAVDIRGSITHKQE